MPHSRLLVLTFFAALTAAAADTRLADAAQRGDRAAVRALLQQHADVNAPKGDGSTALHWAALQDDVELAQLLLKAGANPNAATRNGALTPLFMACRNGSAQLIAALLAAGVSANSINANGTSALMAASAAGNPAALQVLLEHGADVNAKEKARGQTALMFAAALNRTDALQLLLKHGADPNVVTKVTKMERVRVDADGNPIPADQSAGRGGAGTAAGETNSAGAPADSAGRAGRGGGPRGGRPATEEANEAPAGAASGTTPAGGVGTAAAEPNSAGAPADSAGRAGRGGGRRGGAPTAEEANEAATSGTTPAEAGRAGRGGRAGDVAAGGPREVGAQAMGGMTALLLAARDGHREAVAALLDGGAKINQPSEADQSTPLVLAIINGHFDLAKYLVERGADPNLASAAGLAALYATVDAEWAPHAWYPQPNVTQEKTSYLDLLTLLLDRGANPNARLVKKLWFRGLAQDPTWVDPSGSTPFWRAAQSADVAAMKLLAAHGADPKIANNQGDTPLMVAAGVGWMANHSNNALNGWLPAIQFCVELDVDVNAVDSRGYTALHGAAYIGENDAVKFLISKGAKIDAKSKAGDTVADMANGPTRFGLPHPETVALLESLGAVNSHNCRSDQCLVAPKEERKPAAQPPATTAPATTNPVKGGK